MEKLVYLQRVCRAKKENLNNKYDKQKKFNNKFKVKNIKTKVSDLMPKVGITININNSGNIINNFFTCKELPVKKFYWSNIC